MVRARSSTATLALVALACCTAGAAPDSPASGPTPKASTAAQHSAPALPPPSERLLWSEVHPRVAHFVPEAILNSRNVEEISMDEDLLRELLWELKQRRARFHWQTGRPLDLGCKASAAAARPGSASRAENLVDAIVNRDATVLATVDYVVPGWGHGYGGLETAVYATATEVLLDKTGAFRSGGEVSFLRPGADIRVQGIQLCTESPKGQHEPQPNDRLLITGYASQVNPGLLYANTVFPVEHEALVPQPFKHIKGRMDWTIEELRSALEEGGRP